MECGEASRGHSATEGAAIVVSIAVTSATWSEGVDSMNALINFVRLANGIGSLRSGRSLAFFGLVTDLNYYVT